VHLATDPEWVPGRQIVVGWLVAHRFKENFRQFIVRAAFSQGAFDILMVVGQQARPELTARR
jgi:hypothetical protein